MRSVAEIEDFRKHAAPVYLSNCKKCIGTDKTCSCWSRFRTAVACYEACIPQNFWHVNAKDIRHNSDQFNNIVAKYVKNMSKALRGGYGLLFVGDNGVGKTIMMSYVLVQAIKQARTTYYTTMPQLDWDIKRGFSDKEAQKRLQWMLTSDFLAIDELGKELEKRDSRYTNQQIERILKQRFDNSGPVLIGSNMDADQLGSDDVYGSSVGSMLHGKYKIIAMDHGDFRTALKKKMAREMEF